MGELDRLAIHGKGLRLDAADEAGFDALLLLGGQKNWQSLSIDQRAVSFARPFVTSRKPIAAFPMVCEFCFAPML
jgi:hypothetical protein